MLHGLTDIRFFAALWIVLYHLSLQPNSLAAKLPLVAYGYTSVSLFFALSGFVLAYNYLERDCTARAFWSARAARLFPVYGFALALSAPFFVHSCRVLAKPFFPGALFAPLLVQAWFPHSALLWNGPSWALSCEAFFYLLFPAILVPASAAFRRNFFLVFTFVWLSSSIPSLCCAWYPFPHAVHEWVLPIMKFNPILRLPDFLLGIGLGTLYVDGFRFDRPRTTLMASLLVLLIVLFLIGPSIPYPGLHNGLLAPLFGLIILALACDGRALNSRIMILLGESSYCIYLLHAPLFDICAWIFKRWGGSNYALFEASYVALVISAGIAALKLIEIPGRRWVRNRLSVCPKAV